MTLNYTCTRDEQRMMRVKSIEEWINYCSRSMDEAELVFGHGTDNSVDEAAWLVLHVLGQSLDGSATRWDNPVTESAGHEIEALLRSRIDERRPLAYLLGEAWFCGLRFQVNESVLIPRSPFAELIAGGFEPWMTHRPFRTALELCTGCGCIAIAMAHYHETLTVDAVDISADALVVARQNVAAHGLADRVRLLQSDLFEAVHGRRYDVLVSNPPYVSDAEISGLPAEYRWEPGLALRAEDDGLEIVMRILREAPDYLEEEGVLFCEVGEAAGRLQERLPNAPFTWLEFEHGGGGIFTIDRAQLLQLAAVLDRSPARP